MFRSLRVRSSRILIDLSNKKIDCDVTFKQTHIAQIDSTYFTYYISVLHRSIQRMPNGLSKLLGIYFEINYF